MFRFEIRKIHGIHFHPMSNEFRGFCIWWIFCTSTTSAKSAGCAEFTWPVVSDIRKIIGNKMFSFQCVDQDGDSIMAASKHEMEIAILMAE